MWPFGKNYEVMVPIPMDTWLIPFEENEETASSKLGLYAVVVYAENMDDARRHARELVKRMDTVRRLPR